MRAELQVRRAPEGSPARLPLAAGAAVLLALTLAGCGGSSSSGSSASVTTGAVALPYTSTPAATTPGCDSTPVTDAVHDSSVTQIHVIGGCSMVSIETSLTRADVAKAQAICEAAAKVAYVGQVSSVSVDGADHHELAAGEKGMEGCIGEP